MRCQQYSLLLHAFLDGELDARHVHELEAHVPACRRCARELHDYRQMRRRLSQADMKYSASAALRRDVEGALPPLRARAPKHRSLIRGFAMGGMASAALAASLAVFVMFGQQDRFAVDELVS